MKEAVGLIFVLIMIVNIILVFVKAKYSERTRNSLQEQSTKDGLFQLLSCFFSYSIKQGDYNKGSTESFMERFPGYIEENVPAFKKHTKKLKDLLIDASSGFSDETYMNKLTEDYITVKNFPAVESLLAFIDKEERIKSILGFCQLFAALGVLAFILV